MNHVSIEGVPEIVLHLNIVTVMRIWPLHPSAENGLMLYSVELEPRVSTPGNSRRLRPGYHEPNSKG